MRPDLAELCNSLAGYIGEIESGKWFPSVRMIERIAFGLEIESWHLFKNEPISHSDNSGSSPYTELAPSQKKEIMKRANSALAKILDDCMRGVHTPSQIHYQNNDTPSALRRGWLIFRSGTK